MQSTITSTTQLDRNRADAAARQRRAATYSAVQPQDSGRWRRPLVSGLTAGVLALGIVTGAAAQTIASQPVQHGYEAGLPDGWFDPSAPAPATPTATHGSVAQPVSDPVRFGLAAGHADGWFDPASAPVRVAGIVLERPGSMDLVPPNVR